MKEFRKIIHLMILDDFEYLYEKQGGNPVDLYMKIGNRYASPFLNMCFESK